MKPHEEKVYIDIVNEDLEGVTDRQFNRMTEDQKEVYQHKLKKQPEWKLEDVCQYLNNKRLKPVLSRQDVTLKPNGRELILQRVVGHKADLPMQG